MAHYKCPIIIIIIIVSVFAITLQQIKALRFRVGREINRVKCACVRRTPISRLKKRLFVDRRPRLVTADSC